MYRKTGTNLHVKVVLSQYELEYLPRLADRLIRELLTEFPALLVLGPRATGKTTSAALHARSVLRPGPTRRGRGC